MDAINPKPAQNTQGNKTFRWTFIALPVAIFLLCVIMAAVFYARLPAEAAYHFVDGSPDRWLSRSAVILWTIVPQLVLIFIGLMVVFAAAMAVRQLPETPLMRRALLIMGNIVALPQLIIAFAMLDIFLYNIYQIHLIPVWVFALIAMVVAAVIH